MVLDANNGENFLTVALRPHLIWGPEDTNLIPRLLKGQKAENLKLSETVKTKLMLLLWKMLRMLIYLYQKI